MSYNFLDKTGLAYFWGKIKDYISKITRNDLAVISSKEYSGIYGSANDQAGASFYFAGVRPNNFYQMWRIKFRVYSNVPNQNEYIQYSEVEYYGNKSDIGYVIFNRIANTSGRCYYYHNLCRLSLTGYNAGYSHILGMGLRSSNNPTSSSYPRYFKIELLETENCTFTFYNTMKKIANISEYSTTNYAGITEYDGANNGLRETGDDTNTWQLRHNAGNFVVSTALYRYMLCLQKNETTLIPMNAVNNSTATTKTLTTDTFNPFGQIVYYNSTNTVNANASVGASALFEQIQLDLRYSFNTGTTLTSHKDVYMVAVPQTNGMAKLHSAPITQTLPTSENGLIYIHLGRAYSNYQIELYPTHLIYEYRNGNLRLYTNNNDKVNVTNIDITGQTTTLLELTKALVTNGKHYARWYSKTDGGSSGISDKPTGTTNASFVCEAYCNRYNTVNDYRYILKCWVTTNKSPYIAIVQQDTTSLSWTLLPTTNTTYSSKTAASGGTDVSLVTTGEKYTWNNKQSALATQTAYTSKGSATKVPQITTNTLGQVTGITEVTITQPEIKISDVQINGTTIVQQKVANLLTNTAYNSTTNKLATMTDVVNNRGAENPIATILAYAGSEAPNGYLLCRGQAVSRTTYSLLFDAIGTQYGSGDGSTTFNIPDLQGKVIAGLDIVDEDFNVLGKTGGSKTVQLTKNQLPKINGSFTMHGAGTSTPVSSVSGDFTSDYNNTKYKNGGTEASGAGSKGNVKLVIGNDEAHENKQPYNTLNYIIKAYSGTDMPVPVESSSVKNSYDDSVANVYSTNYINTRVRGKKLWTNPNPTSNFAAQTITFDETNDYDFYKIKIKYGTDEGYAYNWQDVEVGDIFNLLLMWSYTPDMLNPNIKGYVGTGFRPECSCNHNSITFTNAVYYTSMDSTKLVNDTSHCIPLEIYGYYI